MFTDRNFISNEQPYTQGLDAVTQLEPKMYRSLGETVLGLLAQDVYPHMPEAVYTPDNADSPMRVLAANIIPALINSIKELKSHSDNLQHRIEVLEEKILSKEG